MKKKIRVQKLFILFFMGFAVFNYNNCELSSSKNESTKIEEVPGEYEGSVDTNETISDEVSLTEKEEDTTEMKEKKVDLAMEILEDVVPEYFIAE